MQQAGLIRLKVVVLKDEKNKKSYSQSAQMACEAASAIRTVASLTREDDCSRIYSTVSCLSRRCFRGDVDLYSALQYLDEPMRVAHRSAIFANGLYSLSQRQARLDLVPRRLLTLSHLQYPLLGSRSGLL